MKAGKRRLTNGILLLHRENFRPAASTISEHLTAFHKYSRFPVFTLNAFLGFPSALTEYEFPVIIIHYSLLASESWDRSKSLLTYLDSCDTSYKIAFVQDEYMHSKRKFDFLNERRVDCVYTCVEPRYHGDTYLKHTRVSKLVCCIPGYVADEIVQLGKRLTRPDGSRGADIGYRGRRNPPYLGKGAREKWEIGIRFRQLAAGLDLSLDIEVEECQRIYGHRWYEFLAGCRAVLGVESGATLFDIEDEARREYERLEGLYPGQTVDDLMRDVLDRLDGKIPVRTLSPRHFEAAAFRVCQILFEGDYSGILKPRVHYIPLKKDFSNFDDVVLMFRDAAFRRELTENAYCDLVASGMYSYKQFMQDFDEELLKSGVRLELACGLPDRVALLLSAWQALERQKRALRGPFPGRQIVAQFAKPALSAYRGLRPSHNGS